MGVTLRAEQLDYNNCSLGSTQQKSHHGLLIVLCENENYVAKMIIPANSESYHNICQNNCNMISALEKGWVLLFNSLPFDVNMSVKPPCSMRPCASVCGVV